MRILIMTGHGLSEESGVSSFRGADGRWQFFSPYHPDGRKGFAQASRAQRMYYDARKHESTRLKPNAAHYALTHLQQTLRFIGHSVLICTNCLDDFHERAGSDIPIHRTGNYCDAQCWACKKIFRLEGDLMDNPGCPLCGHADSAMPAVAWFGTEPFGTREITKFLETADLFVAIGTSATFQPADKLISAAWHRNIRTIELNTDGSATSGLFHERRIGIAVETVPIWVREIIGR